MEPVKSSESVSPEWLNFVDQIIPFKFVREATALPPLASDQIEKLEEFIKSGELNDRSYAEVDVFLRKLQSATSCFVTRSDEAVAAISDAKLRSFAQNAKRLVSTLTTLKLRKTPRTEKLHKADQNVPHAKILSSNFSQKSKHSEPKNKGPVPVSRVEQPTEKKPDSPNHTTVKAHLALLKDMTEMANPDWLGMKELLKELEKQINVCHRDFLVSHLNSPHYKG